MSSHQKADASEAECFDIGHWQAVIIFALGDFRDLSSYARDREAVQSHADRREILRFNKEGESTVDNDPLFRTLLRETVLAGVARSSGTHLQLLLVYVMAMLERIVDDLLVLAFRARPEWMHDYLRVGSEVEIKGMLSLRDVVGSGTKDELVHKLARRAADAANKGTFTDRLKRIERLFGVSFPPERIENVAALANSRNRLVHELRLETISEEEVEDAFDLALQFLKDLGLAAQKANLPYKDPGGLLT